MAPLAAEHSAFSNMADFTVYHQHAGEIIRYGSCLLDSDAAMQADPSQDEAVHLGAALSPMDYVIIIPSNGAKPYPRELSDTEKANRRALAIVPPAPDALAVVLAALEAKGMTITEDDIAAARAKLVGESSEDDAAASGAAP